jgi:hypothetical protein
VASPHNSGRRGASRLERLAWILGAGAGLLSFGLSPFEGIASLAYIAGFLAICAIILRSRRVHPRTAGGNLVARTLAFGGKLVIAIVAVVLLVHLASQTLKRILF